MIYTKQPTKQPPKTKLSTMTSIITSTEIKIFSSKLSPDMKRNIRVLAFDNDEMLGATWTTFTPAEYLGLTVNILKWKKHSMRLVILLPTHSVANFIKEFARTPKNHPLNCLSLFLEQGCARPGVAEFMKKTLLLKKNGLLDKLVIVTQAKSGGKGKEYLDGYDKFINKMWTAFFLYKFPEDKDLLGENGMVFDEIKDGVRNKDMCELYPNAYTVIVDDICTWKRKHVETGNCSIDEIGELKVRADLAIEVPEYHYDFPQKDIPEKYQTAFNRDYGNFRYNPSKNNLNDTVLVDEVFPVIEKFFSDVTEKMFAVKIAESAIKFVIETFVSGLEKKQVSALTIQKKLAGWERTGSGYSGEENSYVAFQRKGAILGAVYRE